MPKKEGAAREQGFRSSLFGFDKNDVLAYMNSLAEEKQRESGASQEQIDKLQAEVDRLTAEQDAARQSADDLRQELEEATRRADEAEINLAALQDASQNHTSHYRSLQDELNHARLRCRDLEKENARLQQELEEAKKGAAPAAADPADVIAALAQPMTDARREALHILDDARLYAESAEQLLQQQADEQKQRMAAHAADIAAGILLLRRRLNRVDEKLGSATMDLENATAAVYTALDQADRDLNALCAQMQAFADGDPENDPVPAPPEPRAKVTAQPVPPRPKGAARPARRPGRLRRTVSRELWDARAHFDDDL